MRAGKDEDRDMFLHSAAALTLALLGACGSGTPQQERHPQEPTGAEDSAKGMMKQSKVRLELPRSPDEGELVWLRITAGPLPPGARILVRTHDGEIAGAVAPYGATASEATAAYTVALPEGALSEGGAEFFLELEEPGSADARAPNPEEVVAMELVLVPAEAP